MSEGAVEPEIADTVCRAIRAENDDSSRMEGWTIEAELRAMLHLTPDKNKEKKFSKATTKTQKTARSWTCSTRERERKRVQKRARPDIRHVNSMVR